MNIRVILSKTFLFKFTIFFLFTCLQFHNLQTVYLSFTNNVMAEDADSNSKGIKDPVLSTLMERDIRVPHTKQVSNGNFSNLVSVKVEDALGAKNILNKEIIKVSNPHDDLLNAIEKLSEKAEDGLISVEDAKEIIDILLGTTSGRIYDGFSLLNFNRWNETSIPASAFPADAVIGEYKTKTIRHAGIIERNFKTPSDDVNPDLILNENEADKDANEVTIWEVDVNMLWYGQQFDSDTFFIHVPIINFITNVPSLDDTIRINYHIYSLIDDDFAPTQILFDANPGAESQSGGSVRLPHKGEDTVWVSINKNSVNHITVQHTALRFLRGIYTWGWRIHPPRIHFLEFLFELKNAHTEKIELDPRSLSMATRNRELNIDGIGDSAPEKKLYKVALAALNNTVTAAGLFDMLNNSGTEPKGVYTEWIELMSNQLQLPPEVNDTLASDGKSVNDYDFVSVYLNNEMYGTGPLGMSIRNWNQGDTLHNRIFNMDNHTHYYKCVDFGPPLNEDIHETVTDGSGIFSFEIMNFKPLYGVPKVAEMQWRTGWGFRPHYSVIQQSDTFPRKSEKEKLKPFAAPIFSLNKMAIYNGYQYSKDNRKGDFNFNPPRYIIQREASKTDRIQSKNDRRAFDSLYEFTREYPPEILETFANRWKETKRRHRRVIRKGVTIGRRTEGYGIAKMCNHVKHVGDFCSNDLSGFHPLNIRNIDTDRNINDSLKFPTFLINPDQNGGDIIPPSPAWEPFLFLSPENGTIYIDPDNREKGYWADLTYAHGRPLPPLENMEVNIEMPREKGQLFYQFDDLFHDNDIFSPHPISSQR